MIKLTREQIILLHAQLIRETGGIDGIRDEGLLDSALNAPFQSFGGTDSFPSIQQKAVRLGLALLRTTLLLMATSELALMPCLFSWL